MDYKRISRLQKQLDAFGNVRSPLDQLVSGTRMVVAGPQIFSIPDTWSFPEFLIAYGRSQLGAEWIATSEASSNPHPLISCLQTGLSAVRPTGRSDGHFIELTMNADLHAFIA